MYGLHRGSTCVVAIPAAVFITLENGTRVHMNVHVYMEHVCVHGTRVMDTHGTRVCIHILCEQNQDYLGRK